MIERLELRYVDLATLRRWDRNAKRHDIGALAESITRHGFRDPPAYDPALNAGEGGIVEGNGRGDALSAMQAQGQSAPRGVVVEGGAWLVPVLFGVDAPSQAAAEAYGVAHNNLTMAGGDFTDLDMAGMWEPEGYAALLRSLAEQGEIPVSIDATALDALLAGLAGTGEPGNLWQGMPEFEQEDKAWKTLTMYFLCAEDYASFQEAIGQRLTEKTTATWYPKQNAVAMKEYTCE